MADDHFGDLLKARAALVDQRRTCVQTVGMPGGVADGAIKALIEVQQAINVIDQAIQELEEAAFEDELEEIEEESD